MNKQISLTLPEPLWALSRQYTLDFGYRSIQEFILDILRKKVVLDNTERYKKIEERMKKGIGVKKFTQQEAIHFIKGL